MTVSAATPITIVAGVGTATLSAGTTAGFGISGGTAPYELSLATERIAASLAALIRPGDAILLSGDLGAGKTAFARAFLRALTGDPVLDVPSPTFTLVQTYDTPKGSVHHYDLWRLTDHNAMAELGWDDALEDIVLVEWPDRLGPLTPPHALTLALRPTGDYSREATLTGWADRL